jgi:hypothetical protein
MGKLPQGMSSPDALVLASLLYFKVRFDAACLSIPPTLGGLGTTHDTDRLHQGACS